ncbi:MAG: EAL domain-containing protein [Lachnospiraceae bacterium]|nr:EAL domain-containing protein [Lachnospiraceae bacterium]
MIWYDISFKMVMFAMATCLYMCRKESGKIKMLVVQILSSGLLVVFVNYVRMVSGDKLVASVCMSLNFAGVTWLMMFLLGFILTFCGIRVRKDVIRYSMLVAVADNLSMLANIFFEHAYSLENIGTLDGRNVYDYVPTAFFWMHYVLICALVFLCITTLIYKMFKSPAPYHSKYLMLMGVIGFVFVLNLAKMYFSMEVDISVLAYGLAGIAIYYSSMIFIPQQFLDRSLQFVGEDMLDMIIILDLENICIYANKAARKYFSMNDVLKFYGKHPIYQWCMDFNTKQKDDGVYSKRFKCEEKTIHINVQCHKQFDKKGRFVGSVFVIKDRTVEVEEYERQKFLETHDPLTGVYNKEAFYLRAAQLLQDNPEEEFLVICSDIHKFKLVNDIFGTETGNQMLQTIANVLKERCDEMDVYGRLGNDRFGLVMPKKRYDERMFVDGPADIAHINGRESYPLTIYVGVYEVADREMPIYAMCDRAQMAIDSIKGDFEQRVAYYDDRLREGAVKEQELIADFSHAFEKNELKIYLQPQINTKGEVNGAEALVRWIHTKKGLMLPGEFIPIFEKNGLISRLDKYVWELACKQLRKWKDQGNEDTYISVNISPEDFYFMNIYKEFTGLVEKYDINPRNLKLEITESAIMVNLPRQLELIKMLREASFIVEMDDFGSGYSSLNMLKEIQVDVLKLDMAFLKRSENEDRSKIILQTIIEMSKQLDMPVIMEGVETQEQVDFLTSIGCDMFQGFFFARPMEIEKFEEIYLKDKIKK